MTAGSDHLTRPLTRTDKVAPPAPWQGTETTRHSGTEQWDAALTEPSHSPFTGGQTGWGWPRAGKTEDKPSEDTGDPRRHSHIKNRGPQEPRAITPPPREEKRYVYSLSKHLLVTAHRGTLPARCGWSSQAKWRDTEKDERVDKQAHPARRGRREAGRATRTPSTGGREVAL
jgi:hypothetical protein